MLEGTIFHASHIAESAPGNHEPVVPAKRSDPIMPVKPQGGHHRGRPLPEIPPQETPQPIPSIREKPQPAPPTRERPQPAPPTRERPQPAPLTREKTQPAFVKREKTQHSVKRETPQPIPDKHRDVPPSQQNHTPSQENHAPLQQNHAPQQDQEIPGMHLNLSKSMVSVLFLSHFSLTSSLFHVFISSPSQLKTVMQPYLGQSGWYLLRPSSTGGLTLTVR